MKKGSVRKPRIGDWSAEDTKKLCELYPVTCSRKIAVILNRSHKAVTTKAKKLKLYKNKGFGGKKAWTQYDDEYLIKYYPEMDVKQIGKHLGTTDKAIYTRAKNMGLKRSAETISKQREITTRNLTEGGKKTRFSKGSVSWNKGKKQEEFLPPEAIEKSKQTRFKAGQDPHNTKPIGYERISKDGYTEVKVRHTKDGKRNFELKHRLVWEQHNGLIPCNMIIEFIDDDKQNFSIDNLRMVSRQENVIANTLKDTSIVKRFLKEKDPQVIMNLIENHSDIIELKRTQLKLNGKLTQLRKSAKKSSE